MALIHSSIACNLDTNILKAALPLFESEKVGAIEWSFDTLFRHREIPPWFVELLRTFGSKNRLIGHGVYFSLFSGRWSEEQQQWLERLKRMSSDFQFDHISEHFGFMTGEHFHAGAPISIPFTSRTLALGQDRLRRIADACGCPVGLENLAIAYDIEEVKAHGEFLGALIEPVNGFIILDLHNLYCHIHNFGIPFEELIRLYPVDKVREIHISGGSWDNSNVEPDKKIRRDTHDDAVPEEVFDLLRKSMTLCPNLKYVVLEQLGLGLKTEASRQQFRGDFLRMEKIVAGLSGSILEEPGNDFLPKEAFTLNAPLEDQCLYAQQMELSGILENAGGLTEARRLLGTSSLANSDWQVERWEPAMLETVLKIAQKWKDGF